MEKDLTNKNAVTASTNARLKFMGQSSIFNKPIVVQNADDRSYDGLDNKDSMRAEEAR